MGKEEKRQRNGYGGLKELPFAFLEKLDVSRARASHEGDRRRIMELIEEDYQGDVMRLNEVLKAAIVSSACTQAEWAFAFLRKNDAKLAPEAALWAATKCDNAAQGSEYADRFQAASEFVWESFQARKRVLGSRYFATWVTGMYWLDVRLRASTVGYWLRPCIVRNSWSWRCAWKERGVMPLD